MSSTDRGTGRAGGARRCLGEKIAGDTAYIANGLTWQWVAVFGVLGFTLFFWGVPALLVAKAESIQNPNVREAVWYLVERHARWSQWVAITIAFITLFCAVRNYWTLRKLGRDGEPTIVLHRTSD